jgi:molybdopterin-guanine dinucleotide biosynthesis protein A
MTPGNNPPFVIQIREVNRVIGRTQVLNMRSLSWSPCIKFSMNALFGVYLHTRFFHGRFRNMSTQSDMTVIIQAGGGSTRMGRNKALMPFQNEPLIARIVQRVQPLAAELLITTNQPEELAFLGLPLIPDEIEGLGALGGLYTALRAASYPLAAVVACDMPFVNVAMLIAQRDLLVSEQVDTVLPGFEHGYEPFHAVYRRESCLPAIRRAIDAGKRRAIAWLPDVKVRVMPEDEVRRYDPQLLAFMNVNTPEEFRQAEELAARLEI